MKCSKENMGCMFQTGFNGKRMEVVGTNPDNYEGTNIPWRVEKFWELKKYRDKQIKNRKLCNASSDVSVKVTSMFWNASDCLNLYERDKRMTDVIELKFLGTCGQG